MSKFRIKEYKNGFGKSYYRILKRLVPFVWVCVDIDGCPAGGVCPYETTNIKGAQAVLDSILLKLKSNERHSV